MREIKANKELTNHLQELLKDNPDSTYFRLTGTISAHYIASRYTWEFYTSM